MNKLKPDLTPAQRRESLQDLIRVDEPCTHRSRIEFEIFRDAYQAMGQIRLTGKLDQANAEMNQEYDYCLCQ